MAQFITAKIADQRRYLVRFWRQYCRMLPMHKILLVKPVPLASFNFNTTKTKYTMVMPDDDLLIYFTFRKDPNIDSLPDTKYVVYLSTANKVLEGSAVFVPDNPTTLHQLVAKKNPLWTGAIDSVYCSLRVDFECGIEDYPTYTVVSNSFIVNGPADLDIKTEESTAPPANRWVVLANQAYDVFPASSKGLIVPGAAVIIEEAEVEDYGFVMHYDVNPLMPAWMYPDIGCVHVDDVKYLENQYYTYTDFARIEDLDEPADVSLIDLYPFDDICEIIEKN